MTKTAKNSAEHILPLYMNGLAGRMLRLLPPQRKKREILFVYGVHTSLERMSGASEFLNKYGAVTIPDLPGFGGMEPFYKLGIKPSLDNMADYLAAFIKLRFRNKRLTLVGMSYGFVVVTRMLQKYPEIVAKTDLVISMAGFSHNDDFKFKRRTKVLFRWGTKLLSTRLMAWFLKYVALRGPFIKATYRLVENKHSKMKGADRNERRRRINFEVYLWQCNDPRTYMAVGYSMLKVNLRNDHVNLPVHHVSVSEDRYFNSLLVEQNMRTIYTDFIHYRAKAVLHAGTIMDTAKEASHYIPPGIRRLLNKKPGS